MLRFESSPGSQLHCNRGAENSPAPERGVSMTLKHGVFIVLCLTLLAGTPAGFAADAFESERDLGRWMSFYYRNPAPDRVPEALEFFCDSPSCKTIAAPPMAAFFAALFKQDGGLMQKTFDRVSLDGSEKARILLVKALSLTNSEGGRKLLREAAGSWQAERLRGVISQELARTPADFVPPVVGTPTTLDMLWAAFYATGDETPVLKIISVAHLGRDGEGADKVAGAAATWALGFNAKHHPRVLEICRKALETAQGSTREILVEVVNGAAGA